MRLITVKVYDAKGGYVVVNAGEQHEWIARGYAMQDPNGGTFTREKPIVVKSTKGEAK